MDRRSSIRALAIGCFLFLIIQFAFSRAVDECYPGWLLPGFGGSARAGEFVTRKVPEFEMTTAGGTVREISKQDLFMEMPPPRRRSILTNVFPKSPIDSAPDRRPDSPSGLWSKIRSAYGSTRPVSAEHSEEVRAWLRRNLERSTGERPRRLTVRWKEVRIRRASWERAETEIIRTIELDLGDEASRSEGAER